MPKKRLKKTSGASLIPGIYNYCDRWCERCNQKLHCMSFVMREKIEERGGIKLDEVINHEDENVWPRLKDVFESTYEILREIAEERGIEISDICASENIDKEFWQREYRNIEERETKTDISIEASDIMRMCLIYEDIADKSLENIFEILNKEKGLEDISREINDALDIVNWYLDLIQVRIRQAKYVYSHPEEETGVKKQNYNGFAKVALLAIDSSIISWELIAEKFPQCQRSVQQLSVILEQIKNDVEREFPKARAFLRPGFEI